MDGSQMVGFETVVGVVYSLLLKLREEHQNQANKVNLERVANKVSLGKEADRVNLADRALALHGRI